MEFQYVYLLNCNKEIEEYIFEDDEVSEVKYVYYEELEKMVKERVKGLLIHEEEYEYIRNNYKKVNGGLNDMNETYKFLKENTKVNFVSTINGDKPSCRPFGDPILFDNKIYVITNKQKNVSKQIAKNNNVCIVAYDNENWIRINCKLIDDSNNIEAKKAVINEFDWAIEAGYTLDNPDFQILYIANADSTIYNEDGEIIANYEF